MIGNELERRLIRRYAETAGRTRDRLEADLRRAAPVGSSPDRPSGGLRDSCSVSIRREGDGFRFTVIAAAPHASYVNDGTSPHPIIGNPLLRFDWPKAGGVVYFRRVSHPGTQPQRFFDTVLDSFPAVLEGSLP